MADERWATFDVLRHAHRLDGRHRAGSSRASGPRRTPTGCSSRYHELEPQVEEGRAIPYRDVLAETLARVARGGADRSSRERRARSATPFPPGSRSRRFPAPWPSCGARLQARPALEHRSRVPRGLARAHRRSGGRPGDRGRRGLLQAGARPLGALLRALRRGPRAACPRGGEPLPRHRASRASSGSRAVWINRLGETSDLPRAAELKDLSRLPRRAGRAGPGQLRSSRVDPPGALPRLPHADRGGSRGRGVRMPLLWTRLPRRARARAAGLG